MTLVEEKEMHPRWDWSQTTPLYRCEGYAAIWGMYKADNGKARKCLGVRWTGESGSRNFPISRGRCAWIVEPDFVAQGILLSLLQDTIAHSSEYGNVDGILEAIKELAEINL